MTDEEKREKGLKDAASLFCYDVLLKMKIEKEDIRRAIKILQKELDNWK